MWKLTIKSLLIVNITESHALSAIFSGMKHHYNSECLYVWILIGLVFCMVLFLVLKVKFGKILPIVPLQMQHLIYASMNETRNLN